MSHVSILICEDSELIGRGLQAVFSHNPDFTVVGCVKTGEEALALLEHVRPDVIVMDICLAGGMDGIETTLRVKQFLPSAGIVVLTASPNRRTLLHALGAGANAYCLKDLCSNRITSAVAAAQRGAYWIDPRLVCSVIPQIESLADRQNQLSMLEHTILDYIAQGPTSLHIAAKLGINEDDVKAEIKDLFEKLQLQKRTELILEASRIPPATLPTI